MFGDTLLESSSTARRRKRWPMATAFTVETIVAAIIVIVPLLSTGVIPVSARMTRPVPLKPVTLEPVRQITDRTPRPSGPTRSAPSQPEVMLVSDKPNRLTWPSDRITTTDPDEVKPPGHGTDIGKENNLPGDLLPTGPSTNTNVRLGPKRVISQLTEAQLLNKVEPVYPRIAVLSGVQGQVKLHAIIARNGSIESLNVISGHPLLIRAATDAVSQWRYRPYILNGEAVEVETFITVNFKKDGK
jgi:protein TonB